MKRAGGWVDGSGMGVGYRHILGVDQWLCDADRCNRNLSSAALAALPEPLALNNGAPPAAFALSLHAVLVFVCSPCLYLFR